MAWWTEEEAAEWAEEEARHMKADYIWQCNREARFGAERRVWHTYIHLILRLVRAKPVKSYS